MCVIEWLKEEMKHGPPRRPYRQNKKIRGEIIGSMARHSAALQYQNRDETAESMIRTVHEIPRRKPARPAGLKAQLEI